MIRGRVTDKESGAPIARAVVRLANRDSPDQRVTQTDDDGRYELEDCRLDDTWGLSGWPEPCDAPHGELFADRRGQID